MPIEILGETYLTEAEFAKELGCSAFSLARLRKKREISYQRLPGRRGAFYGKQHVAGCLAALSVPGVLKKDSPPDESRPTGATIPPQSPSTPKADGSLLSDMQRASAILNNRRKDRP